MSSKINSYEEILNNSKTMRYMHLPEGGDINDPKNVLYSIHTRGKKRTAWYCSTWETMETQNMPTNRELVTYKSKIFPYTHLHRSLLTTVTPSIKAKEGYHIKFCDDLFLTMIKEFNLYLNDVHLQYGNKQSLFCQLKTDNNWPKFSKEVGNKQGLNKWSSELFEEPLGLYLPWMYSHHKTDSFPLKFCGHNDRLHHIIEFNLKLSELLLIKDVNTGLLVDFDNSLIEVTGNKDSIDIPEMEGLYSILTKKESEKEDLKLDEINGEKELYSESIYYIEHENKVELGKKVVLNIDSKHKQPIISLYWGAINTEESEIMKTNIFNLQYNGQATTPIKTSKLESSVDTILENKSSYKTERGFLLPLDKQLIYQPGINYYSNNVLTKEDGAKMSTGIILKGGNLTITMKDKGLVKNNHKFLAFAVLKHIKRFKFKSYPKTQEERLLKGCTIEQDDDE